MLVVVAGPPCQQLTVAGPWGGRQGLAGPDSVLFFAVPAIVSVVTALRPDIQLLLLVEQAGTTLAQHRRTMGEVLRIDEAAFRALAPVAGAGEWALLPRRRLLLSAAPPDPQPWRPPQRPRPWRPGWRPHW